ncbi:MAG: Uncharacterized protein G01um101418_792 [Parcubacteria group bacterium Gr01-1014_18]|nr:MAG: Uncharacterized protein Greene041636_674 [Parcubacteria group bacterium Greene0416_36]TSC80094.1 MAG: Uncharacterized protein G01um101418_792 [Parcubacteria group bacterium Gr01-1014_18]TSC98616.1 MAG: Uncharacterized protein Greene101420_668 [Parcubacteria group bacterium Greene1014_20]TSD06443.1 MAG: Uncharacterized protein Greene07142_934 [Parcubacteria group bacterium Greene0714_2]
MSANNVVLRFSEVNFSFEQKVILDEVSFSVRENSKIALMGQNGAGKSTLFSLVTGESKPASGGVFVSPKETTIGIGRQVMNPEDLDLTIRDYFIKSFAEVPYDLDRHIKEALDVVNLDLPYDRVIRVCSGGQQARLLLAYAIIQNPDILLLDEPTNNLDTEGIDHLTTFLIMYPKTVIVISHDADFLNAFTDGVLYLDVFTHKIEQYTGNYFDAVEQIAARVEKEQLLNVRAEKDIRRLKAQSEVFAHKGGKLRSVAKKMRDAAAEAEESMVDVRREDKTIRDFEISTQEYPSFFDGKIIEIRGVTLIKKHKPVRFPLDILLRRDMHLLVSGPNGIGKSTFLEGIISGKSPDATIGQGVVVGYYRQDFGMLNFKQKAYDCLLDVMEKKDNEVLRSTAARFLLDGKVLDTEIKSLSEGQKALLSFARLVLMKPGLLILDEPTNHINFRHLPVIAAALSEYKGALILVSHIPSFVEQIRIDNTLALGDLV